MARPIGPVKGTSRPPSPGTTRRPEPPGERRRRWRILPALALVGLAAAILIVGAMALRPAAGGLAVEFAASNPQALKVGVVAELVASDLGEDLTAPAGSDDTPIPFVVDFGATASEVALDLADAGLIARPLVFEYLAITGGKADQLQAGTYELMKSMTPPQILAALQAAPIQTLAVGLRESLRLEQAAAYLQTIGLAPGTARDYFDLAMSPTAELRAAYPFLETLPEGRSLEGYLSAGTYEVYPWATGEEIVRLQLDEFGRQMRTYDAIGAAEKAGKDFYEVLSLASIVEREAGVDAERAKIAGVYANRLDPKLWPTGLLEADPTVFYGWDTVQLGKVDFSAWRDYRFWAPIGEPLRGVDLPKRLSGYQTYQQTGMIPGPIATPTQASIAAALKPDTGDDYLFFVLKNDGSRTHAFARTYEEHQANLRKYGYR